MTLYYAGIGSRSTPVVVRNDMTLIATGLEGIGFTLRSGAAEGADSAFEAGVENAKEIFIPWPRFNKHPSLLHSPSSEAIKMAATYHPAWNRCSHGAKLLHARNMHQMLGADLKTAVEFVICYTSDGKDSGGTGQALRVARKLEIPVYNLHHYDMDTVLSIIEEKYSL